MSLSVSSDLILGIEIQIVEEEFTSDVIRYNEISGEPKLVTLTFKHYHIIHKGNKILSYSEKEHIFTLREEFYDLEWFDFNAWDTRSSDKYIIGLRISYVHEYACAQGVNLPIADDINNKAQNLLKSMFNNTHPFELKLFHCLRIS